MLIEWRCSGCTTEDGGDDGGGDDGCVCLNLECVCFKRECVGLNLECVGLNLELYVYSFFFCNFFSFLP